jgi:hypothetical protein
MAVGFSFKKLRIQELARPAILKKLSDGSFFFVTPDHNVGGVKGGDVKRSLV